MPATRGDALPDTVARFLERFAAAAAGPAAECFAADGLYAFPGDPDEERGARIGGAGPDVEAVLAEDPALGRPHRVRACVVEGRDCLVEGWIEDRDGERSFVAALRLDRVGLIARCLCFRCDRVAQAQIDAYFDELEAGRFAAAVERFSEDCLYSHPPYAPGLPRAEFRGHAELLAGFERRGKLSKRHFVLAAAQRGPHFLLEGLVWLEGTAAGRDASFMSTATLAADGRIQRYVAFVCEPAVPRQADG